MLDTVAIVGATGAVGSIILELLEQRKFPARTYRLLASARSAGRKITLTGQEITVEVLTHDCFDGVNLVIASTPDDTAAEFLPSAVKAGAKVIDESGFWRMNPEVALVVPGGPLKPRKVITGWPSRRKSDGGVVFLCCLCK